MFHTYMFFNVDVLLNYIVYLHRLDLLENCMVIVRDTHGGGWSRNINARYLHTLMVYL